MAETHYWIEAKNQNMNGEDVAVFSIYVCGANSIDKGLFPIAKRYIVYCGNCSYILADMLIDNPKGGRNETYRAAETDHRG